MMFPKAAAVLALVAAVSVNAAPAPAPEPGLGDFFNSVFDHATSAVGSAFHEASSAVSAAKAEATVSEIFKGVTKALGTETTQAYATMITSNGVPNIVVTSVGGDAITLVNTATASGMTTSFVGHVFTVASPSSTAPSSSSSSASATATHNAALGMHAPGFSTGSFVSAAAFVGSIVAGASLVL